MRARLGSVSAAAAALLLACSSPPTVLDAPDPSLPPDLRHIPRTGSPFAHGELPEQPRILAGPALPLSLQWSRVETGFTTDDIGLGNVRSTAGDELVVLMQGSNWSEDELTLAAGKVIVLNKGGGAPLQTFVPDTARDVMGLATIDQLVGQGNAEFIVTEAMDLFNAGAVFAGDDTSTNPLSSKWTHAPRDWPGTWNMGPSVGNVLAGGGNDLVVPSYDGKIAVLDRATGVARTTYDAQVQHGELLYGHVAIANVDGNPGDEVVGFGAQSGRVFVLADNGAGALTSLYASNPDASGGFAFGSGPALGDIDGDGSPEIIVAYANSPRVAAFDMQRAGGNCKYQWTMIGAGSYWWTSPAVGDVNGDGVAEAVTINEDGLLSVLTGVGITPDPGGGCVEGGYIVTSYAIGGGSDFSWFTPVITELAAGGGLEIVAANYTTLEVIQIIGGAVNVAFQFVDSSATFYPSAAVASNGDGASIFVSGWENGTIYRLDTPSGSPSPITDWPTFMGNNRRAGACCADNDCSSCAGGSCTESSTDNPDFVCDVPDCNCGFDCVGSDDCKVKCENGSTCDTSCEGIDKCELDKCTEGSSCTLDCAGVTDECRMKCEKDSTCDIACQGAAHCKLDECKEGSVCSVDCSDSTKCESKCDGAESCDVDCSDTEECKLSDCKKGAACNLDCSGSASCRLECKDAGTTCFNDCTNVTDCHNHCEDGAECVVDCTGSPLCDFHKCDGGVTMCANNIIVCNGSCPP